MNKNPQTAEVEWGNIIDSIPDFFTVHDLDHKIVIANKSLADFQGTTKDKLVGKYCYEVFHGTRGPWKGCAHLRCIDSQRTVTEVVDDPNIGFPMMVCCSPYFDKKGELIGSVHIARNITEQHLVAEENENLISDLMKAMTDGQRLSGFLPICASCKKIRDDNGSWNEIESYMSKRSPVQFSHSICPGCSERLYPEFRDKQRE